MSNSKLIENKVKRMVRLMSNWCIDNHAPDFCCEFQFTAYVNLVEVKLTSGSNVCAVGTLEYSFYLDDDYSFESCCEKYKEMIEFKKHHEIHFSAERQEEIKEKERIKRIESLKSQLASLESR